MPRPDSNAIIHTCLTLSSTLWMGPQGLRAALEEDPLGYRYPDHNPLVQRQPGATRATLYDRRAIDADKLPGRMEIPVVWWEGARAGNERTLSKFVKHTHGEATFVLVTDEGKFRPYRVREGKLIRVTSPVVVEIRPPSAPNLAAENERLRAELRAVDLITNETPEKRWKVTASGDAGEATHLLSITSPERTVVRRVRDTGDGEDLGAAIGAEVKSFFMTCGEEADFRVRFTALDDLDTTSTSAPAPILSPTLPPEEPVADPVPVPACEETCPHVHPDGPRRCALTEPHKIHVGAAEDDRASCCSWPSAVDRPVLPAPSPVPEPVVVETREAPIPPSIPSGAATVPRGATPLDLAASMIDFDDLKEVAYVSEATQVGGRPEDGSVSPQLYGVSVSPDPLRDPARSGGLRSAVVAPEDVEVHPDDPSRTGAGERAGHPRGAAGAESGAAPADVKGAEEREPLWSDMFARPAAPVPPPSEPPPPPSPRPRPVAKRKVPPPAPIPWIALADEPEEKTPPVAGDEVPETSPAPAASPPEAPPSSRPPTPAPRVARETLPPPSPRPVRSPAPPPAPPAFPTRAPKPKAAPLPKPAPPVKPAPVPPPPKPAAPKRPKLIAFPTVEEHRAMLAKPLTPAEHARAAVVVALDAEDDEMSRGALIAAASRLKPMPRETFVAAIDLLVRDGAVLESVGLYRLAPRDGD